MRIYCIILLSFLLISCDFSTFRENKEEDKQDAEKITEKFYDLLKDGNKTEVVKLFSNKFFQTTNEKDLSQLIDWSIMEGKTSFNYTLINWHTLVVKGTDSKAEYTLTYNVHRGKIKTEETFNMEKEKDKIKIVGYKIDIIIPNKN